MLTGPRGRGIAAVLLAVAGLWWWLGSAGPVRSDGSRTGVDHRRPAVRVDGAGSYPLPDAKASPTKPVRSYSAEPRSESEPVETRLLFVGPNQEPVPSISYKLVASDGDIRLGRANSDGIATVPTRSGLRYELIGKYRRLAAVVRTFQGGRRNVRIALSRSVQIVGVVEADGGVLTGCTVRARPIVPGYTPSPAAAPWVTSAVSSDSYGRFTIYGCVPGQLYRLTAGGSPVHRDVVASAQGVALSVSPLWTVVLRRGRVDSAMWWDVRPKVSKRPVWLPGSEGVDGRMPQGVDAIRVPIWAGKSVVAFRDKTTKRRTVEISLPWGGGEVEVVDPAPAPGSGGR